jgi:hypothetical protein
MHKYYGDHEHFDVMMEDEMLFDVTQAGTTAQANQLATLGSTFHNSFVGLLQWKRQFFCSSVHIVKLIGRNLNMLCNNQMELYSEL